MAQRPNAPPHALQAISLTVPCTISGTYRTHRCLLTLPAWAADHGGPLSVPAPVGAHATLIRPPGLG